MIARTLLALWALALVLGPPRAGSAADGLHLVLTPSQKPTDLLATGEEFGKVLAGLIGMPVRVSFEQHDWAYLPMFSPVAAS